MKGTEQFKADIEKYLIDLAKTDELFFITLQKPGKNVDDCITYILNTVKTSDSNGFTDNEIYGMAVHYYEEDNINVGKPISCQVVVNHQVMLTPEEIEQARQNAIKKVENDIETRMTIKKKVKHVEEPMNTLF